MFTGIVETTGHVIQVLSKADGVRLTLEVPSCLGVLGEGNSLAVNGVCLTAVNPAANQCDFDVIHETLRRTNLGQLRVGHRVNLERSIRAGDRFEGHLVQGHVDAVVEVNRVQNTGSEQIFRFRHDGSLTPLIIPKGSVAINGVSLTVVEVQSGEFAVALIPTTLSRTNLADLRVGDRVNLETDIVSRTILHQLRFLHGSPTESSPDADWWEKLRNHGFA